MLRLSKDQAAWINYVLNDQFDYTMQPGHSQPLVASRTWTAAFDRGNSSGIQRVELTEGIYDFCIRDSQWTLEPEHLEISLDNTASDVDFTVLIDNKPVTIGAGESKQLNSTKPLVMKYDRTTRQRRSSSETAQ